MEMKSYDKVWNRLLDGRIFETNLHNHKLRRSEDFREEIQAQ